jgi:prepilin-type processing-associated H-X9-DG protein
MGLSSFGPPVPGPKGRTRDSGICDCRVTAVAFSHDGERLATGGMDRIVCHGTSNTYLVGEKYVDPFAYYSGQEEGDDEPMLIGMDMCISHCTALPPVRDRLNYKYFFFGSAHAGGCNMLYCDGRVGLVAYSVDPAAHRRAGNRFGQ